MCSEARGGLRRQREIELLEQEFLLAIQLGVGGSGPGYGRQPSGSAASRATSSEDNRQGRQRRCERKAVADRSQIDRACCDRDKDGEPGQKRHQGDVLDDHVLHLVMWCFS